jgi:hypothetical protein
MRGVMNDPAVRRKISEGTKEAIASTSPELQILRVAWRAAQPVARKRFLDEILSSVCSALASSEPGGPDEQPN